MRDYYNIDELYENCNKEEVMRFEIMQAAMRKHNQGLSLKEELVSDMGCLNDLLNKKEIKNPEKYNIAMIMQKTSAEYLNAVQTVESFENFMREKLGKERLEEYTREWIEQEKNSLFDIPKC